MDGDLLATKKKFSYSTTMNDCFAYTANQRAQNSFSRIVQTLEEFWICKARPITPKNRLFWMSGRWIMLSLKMGLIGRAIAFKGHDPWIAILDWSSKQSFLIHSYERESSQHYNHCAIIITILYSYMMQERFKFQTSSRIMDIRLHHSNSKQCQDQKTEYKRQSSRVKQCTQSCLLNK